TREIVLSARVEDRGRVMHRRIDEAVIGLGVAAAGDELRCGLQWRRRGIDFGLFGHSSILWTPRATIAICAGFRVAGAATRGHDVTWRDRQPLDPRSRSFCDAASSTRSYHA